MRGVRMAERSNALIEKNWPVSLEAVQSSILQAAVMVRGDALMDALELVAAVHPRAALLIGDLIRAEDLAYQATKAALEKTREKVGE